MDQLEHSGDVHKQMESHVRVLSRSLRHLQEHVLPASRQLDNRLQALQEENARLRRDLDLKVGIRPPGLAPLAAMRLNGLAQSHGSLGEPCGTIEDVPAMNAKTTDVDTPRTTAVRPSTKMGWEPSSPPSPVGGPSQMSTRSSMRSLASIDGIKSDTKKSKAKKVFADAEALKVQVRQAILKPEYTVTSYYKEAGIWQAIARSSLFDNCALTIIALNAVWISVDLDLNKATVLYDALPIFQVVEHFFCTAFTAEWLIRFLSFQHKRNCFRDGWFMFDSVLVAVMVSETWILTVVLALQSSADGGSGLGNTSVLRIARLFRLTRAARVARLLRVVPELLVLIKGMVIGFRAVCFTILLLAFFVYIFAITFTQLTADTNLQGMYFKSVPDAMYSLSMGGILADQATFMDNLGNVNALYAVVFSIFFVLGSLTVLNMLLGVLVDVVKVVSSVEKDKSDMIEVKARVMEALGIPVGDENCSVTKDDYRQLLLDPAATKSLDSVGIDSMHLVDSADFMFKDVREIEFAELLNLIFNMRGREAVRVKDMVELRKAIITELHYLREIVSSLKGESKEAVDFLDPRADFSPSYDADKLREGHESYS
eukprot:TRINITY_DN23549_c1_g1_i1.p1 TRINITY_DN23549_c1_g1~~TRINITY_DN23549_c1_g1_i1.p1  ORF type:complete len:627 (-),score=82.24 TRINITY_DN23549_c1_g1_i1:577-2370(-)